MADGGQSSTLRFTCDECGTHLGVDESLAGMEAPCPMCGAAIVAPESKTRKSRLPTSGVVRGVSGNGGFQSTPRERSAGPTRTSGGTEASSGRMKSRTVVPGGGPAANELRILIKLLVAVGLAIFVVVLVTWFLKNQ